MTDRVRPLTLNELIRTLQQYVDMDPQAGDQFVGVSKDPEGNGFATLCGPDQLLAVGVAEVYGRDESGINGQRVTVLWPGYPQFDLGESN